MRELRAQDGIKDNRMSRFAIFCGTPPDKSVRIVRLGLYHRLQIRRLDSDKIGEAQQDRIAGRDCGDCRSDGDPDAVCSIWHRNRGHIQTLNLRHTWMIQRRDRHIDRMLHSYCPLGLQVQQRGSINVFQQLVPPSHPARLTGCKDQNRYHIKDLRDDTGVFGAFQRGADAQTGLTKDNRDDRRKCCCCLGTQGFALCADHIL